MKIMKLKASALAEQRFKARVKVVMATDELDRKGRTVYGEMTFIAHYKCLPLDVVDSHWEELEDLRRQGKYQEALVLGKTQVRDYFIGFEAVPGEDLPFTDDDGQPLPSNPESIELLLNSKEINDAICQTYSEARVGDRVGKNSRP